MKKANTDIRDLLKKDGIPLWRLGVAWGCNEVTTIRRLRLELSKEDKTFLRKLIEQIKKEDA